MRICKVLLTILLLHVCVISSYESRLTVSERRADFMTTLNHILVYEGYYANVMHDKGRETYAGITRRYNPEWRGWLHIDNYKRVRKIHHNEKIEDILIDHWVLDYYLDIWVREGFYKLRDQEVANYLFDFRINATVGTKITKKVIREMGYDIEINNHFTEGDMWFVNKMSKKELLNKLKKRRVRFYNGIVSNNYTQSKFLSHWLLRANNI
jgi:lysozyme family protein